MNVNIRPLREEDAYKSVVWRNDPEVFKYTGNLYDHEILIDSELNWIRKAIAKREDYRCAIEVDGVYVGNVYLLNVMSGIAEFHIFIGEKSYWGKGVAKMATRQIVDYGFNAFNLDKITLSVRVANIRAFNLYLSVGFVEKLRDNDWIFMEIDTCRYLSFVLTYDRY